MQIDQGPCKCMSPKAAGTINRRLSGFVTKAHLAFKHSFPHLNKVKSIHDLAQGVLQAGFTAAQINEALKSIRVQLRIEDPS